MDGLKFTVIRVKVSDRERLKRMGEKGETYDEIVTRLIDSIESQYVK